ncbi:cytochrome P450 [Aspergillus melleus]|uniref:cytochrome P450 n=1 Tax=Aspergillus melleus TaxID=138277 RepID=UPI001E8E8B06|nr:uncharacterized protein LDX57_007858 [Aspergillus melleus]KAH8430188.1 hypothetical protein LDX57_007858 [Aspergillus melleus]
MWECHESYGKVVRYAPNRILINSARAVNDVYNHNGSLLKSQAYDALVHKAPNILTLRHKKLHNRRRRVLSQALSDDSIMAYQPRILEKVWKFVRVLSDIPENDEEEKWSAPIDVARLCDYLTFDIVTSIVFSSDCDMLGKEEHRGAVDAILNSNVRMAVLFQYPALRYWKIHKQFFPAAIAARSVLISFVTRLLRDRAKHAERKGLTFNDLYSFLAKSKEPETDQGFSPNELAAEATTLIVAGADTTSTAIAGIFFYLAKHPEYQERARVEVKECFSRPEEIVLGGKLSACKFLSACINEAMRLSPPVGSSLWRESQSNGVMVDNVPIPQGYDVGVGIWSVHHDAKHYYQPFAYRPERWLAQSQPARDTILAAYLPFSRGSRSCIGKSIATAELMLTLAVALWKLEWRFTHDAAPDKDENFEVKEHITGQKEGLNLQVRALH